MKQEIFNRNLQKFSKFSATCFSISFTKLIAAIDKAQKKKKKKSLRKRGKKKKVYEMDKWHKMQMT